MLKHLQTLLGQKNYNLPVKQDKTRISLPIFIKLANIVHDFGCDRILGKLCQFFPFPGIHDSSLVKVYISLKSLGTCNQKYL